MKMIRNSKGTWVPADSIQDQAPKQEDNKKAIVPPQQDQATALTRYSPLTTDDLLKVIKLKRNQLNLSQKDVATTIGITPAAYSYLESGTNKMNTYHLLAILSALNLSLHISDRLT